MKSVNRLHPDKGYTMYKILLLGATGFIGSNIARELESNNREWLGVSRTNKSKAANIATFDERERLLNFLKQKPIVINALGGLKPKDYTIDTLRAIDEFWEAMYQVLNLLREAPPASYFQISSAGTIYGEAQSCPSVETDYSAPSSWYGRMKVVEEALYMQYAQDHGVNYTCARVTNPFGNENHPTHGLVDVIVDHIKRNKMFTISFKDGACRDFIYAPTMARIIVNMADSIVPGVFNVGSGKSIPLADIISVAKKACPEAKFQNSIASTTDVVKSHVSIDKLKRNFDINIDGPTATEYLIKKISQVTV